MQIPVNTRLVTRQPLPAVTIIMMRCPGQPPLWKAMWDKVFFRGEQFCHSIGLAMAGNKDVKSGLLLDCLQVLVNVCC